MTKRFFLFRSAFWITVVKCLALAFVASMILLQIPELSYDFGAKLPLEISGPKQLQQEVIQRTTFASIAGRPNFERAFIYQRYGMRYTYFLGVHRSYGQACCGG